VFEKQKRIPDYTLEKNKKRILLLRLKEEKEKMEYSQLIELYEKLEKTSKRLEKTEILAEFLKKVKHDKNIIYLVHGQVFPDYDEKELGISEQLVIKALSAASGENSKHITELWRKKGDLGLVAEEVVNKKKQGTLFSKKLTSEKVLENLRKLPELIGKGTVDRKMGLIAELLTSARALEAKYLIRTILGDLRIGVAEGVIRDAIVWACFGREDKDAYEKVQEAYDKANDFSLVFEKACKGKKELDDVELKPGKPVKVMLALKADNVKDGFNNAGRPAAFEYKYDGFRMLINKYGKEIKIFTRRLDNVTKQFPEVVEYVKKFVHADSYIIDCEAVGYDSKKRYRPFQEISQRIKRKYDIEKIAKELPIELNIFDIIYYNGKNLIKTPFIERRKILEKIVHGEKWKLKLAEQLITDNDKEAEKFYQEALKNGEEGVMIKKLDAPYKPGARVGYMLKLKPEANEFDLVITGAEYGTGKRAGWLTSYDVSCRQDSKLLEIGKVSTGLKEKEEQGLSFIEMTRKLKPLIEKEEGRHVKVKAEIVVAIVFQNIQKSPTYSSGYALRFPRITRLRPDRGKSDIATLKEIEDDYYKEIKWRF
jgi:DNA ligase-1